METVQNEFFDWLCETFGFLEGQDAFENRLPSTIQTGQSMPVLWLLENNSFVVRQFATHTKEKEYNLIINYRAPKADTVNKKVLELEQVINHLHCFELPSYEVRRIQASSFNASLDADAEGYYRGTVNVVIDVIDNYEYADSEDTSS